MQVVFDVIERKSNEKGEGARLVLVVVVVVVV